MQKTKKPMKFIRIEEELLDQIKEVAEKMHASTTWTAGYLLRQQLKAIEQEKTDE